MELTPSGWPQYYQENNPKTSKPESSEDNSSQASEVSPIHPNMNYETSANHTAHGPSAISY